MDGSTTPRQFKHAEAEEFLGIQTKPTRWEMEGVEMTVTEDGCGLEHGSDCKFTSQFDSYWQQ